jgi:hypothetical protein
MFSQTPNVGGKTPCQEDRPNFEINRTCQIMSWPDDLLESYLTDLTEATNGNRNLVSEKYARMMESTFPEEYRQLEPLLDPIDAGVKTLAEEILKVILDWEVEVRTKYPGIAKSGRPLYSSEDSPLGTSFETYLKGELRTYSKKTLELYLQYVLDLQFRKINGALIVLGNMIKLYGFSSMEEADDNLSKRSF